MSFGRNNSLVGRRSMTNCNSRSSFLQNNGGAQMTFPGSAEFQNAQARNKRFTRCSENTWSLGPPTGKNQPQPPQPPMNAYNYNNYNNRSSTPVYPGQMQMKMQPSTPTPIQYAPAPAAAVPATQSAPKVSISTGASQGDNAMADLAGNPNVKYVSLNWEDILGGKEGMQGMRVTMAPPQQGGDNQNRQLQISFGQGGNQQASDGSVPLKVLSFEPVQNYPGQMTGQGQSQPQSQATLTQQRTPRPGQPRGIQNYGQVTQKNSKGQMTQTPKVPSYMGQQQRQQGQNGGMPRTASSSNCGNCPKCMYKQPYRR